jgi:hypothetical protein
MLCSCAYVATWVTPPTLEGHPSLVSQHDLDIVLQIARRRMSYLLTPPAPNRIEVVSATKIVVWYPSPSWATRFVQVERVNNQWRVTDELVVLPEGFFTSCRVYRIDLTMRCSQPLHRVQPHFTMIKTHSFQSSLAPISGG